MRYLFNNHYENHQLYLYSGGYDPTVKGHTYGPTVRSGYMLHYIHSGKGIFTCEGIEYQLKEGDFFFIEPNRIIKYEADKIHPWAFYWIGFRGELVQNYLKRTSISRNDPIFNIEKGFAIKERLSEIIELSIIEEDNDLLLNAKLLEIFYHMSDLFPSEEKANTSKRKTLFVQALQFIRNNYETDLQISELATTLAVDRTYLHRLFKKELDMSPKEYLTEVRIRKAKELLTNTDYPINTIAQSVGYEDAQQFSRIFKQKTKQTPSNYRKGN